MLPNSALALFLSLSLFFASARHNPSSDHSQNSSARIPLEGAKIFQRYCATCHGPDGRGHGPASTSLKRSIPDLTLLSQRNDGKFPYRHVTDIIEGKIPAPLAHGDQQMPIWGPIFHQVEADQDWGEVRLAAVAKYLESIQQR